MFGVTKVTSLCLWPSASACSRRGGHRPLLGQWGLSGSAHRRAEGTEMGAGRTQPGTSLRLGCRKPSGIRDELGSRAHRLGLFIPARCPNVVPGRPPLRAA